MTRPILHVLPLLALAPALGGCIHLLPAPPAPPHLYVLEAGDVARAPGAPIDAVIAVANPDGERAELGSDVVWRTGDTLAFVAQTQWSSRAEDALQAMLAQTLAQQGRFKAALDTFLRTLAKQERWEPPHIKALTGEYSGLSELRWTAGQKEHRIIGYRIDDTKDGQHQYVMLIGCTHKQRNYIPPNALHTAKKRKAEIEKGVARINEYSLIADR